MESVDLKKAKQIVNDFVMNSPHGAEWSQLVSQLLEPLSIQAIDIATFCREAQDGIRGRFPESVKDKPLWNSRTAPWCRANGIMEIIQIVQKTDLRRQRAT